jgi:putative exosortase-associated protein (TIGR04073 family)
MRKTLPLLAALAIASLFSTGCAHVTRMEEKFGRGMGNSMELVRMGEFRRTIEQSSLTDGPEYASTTGFVRGMNRTLSRTGIGVWEVLTAPFPPYHPLFTDKFAVGPVYPDNFKPGVIADSMTATDTYVGFSGGEVLPMVPGSRFRIFEGQ